MPSFCFASEILLIFASSATLSGSLRHYRQLHGIGYRTESTLSVKMTTPSSSGADDISIEIVKPSLYSIGGSKESLARNTLLFLSCLTSGMILPAVSRALTDSEVLEDKAFIASDTFDPLVAAKFAADVEKNRALNSDEFVVKFENASLGLGLTEVSYKGFPVVTVTSIKYPLNNDKDPEFRVRLSMAFSIYVLLVISPVIY